MSPITTAARRVLGRAGLSLLGVLTTAVPPGLAHATEPAVTAFVDVTVLPMDSERILPHQTVVVRGERIEALGPTEDVKVPEGALLVAGEGGYLMPGLADMHTHLHGLTTPFPGPEQLLMYLVEGITTIRNMSGTPLDLQWRQAVESGELDGPTIHTAGPVIIGTGFLTAQRLVFTGKVATAFMALAFLAWLPAWALGRRKGRPAHFPGPWRRVLPCVALAGLFGALLVQTRVISFVATIEGDLPFAHFADTPEEARAAVRKAKRDGYGFAKVYDFLGRDAYVAALDEARRIGLHAVVHLEDSMSIEDLLETGATDIAHVDEFMDAHMLSQPSMLGGVDGVTFDYESIARSAAAAKAHDAIVVSNMVTDESVYRMLEDPEKYLARPEYAVVHPDALRSWHVEGRAVDWQGQQAWRRNQMQPFLVEMTAALHRAGVSLLVGTDTTVEGSLPSHIHRDIELLSEAGLSNFEALVAATRNAKLAVARMGHDDDFGTVEVGKRADLLLSRGNPLERLANTRERAGVMARGRWYPQADLERRVSAYVASY